jgi:PEP-CTERM motif
MSDRIVATALILLATAAPALAGISAGALPEPTTVTLFGLGIGGAYLAKRLISRK